MSDEELVVPEAAARISETIDRLGTVYPPEQRLRIYEEVVADLEDDIEMLRDELAAEVLEK